MSRILKVSLGLALIAALAACGNDPGATASGGFTLRVQTAGGFVPPGADQAAVPEFALTGDGRVVTGGAQIEIYPGPAMPAVNERTISAEGIAAIEREAREAGLFDGDKHYDHQGVADAGTTYFIADLDGTRHVVSAYALGMDLPPAPGATATDGEARAKLQRFREKLGDLASWLPDGSLGDEKAHEVTALRIVSRPGGDNPEDGTRPDEVDWPLATPLATFGDEVGDTRCGVVDGDDLGKVLPLARKATQITLWRSDGKTYTLQFRPQLPEETGCEVPSRA